MKEEYVLMYTDAFKKVLESFSTNRVKAQKADIRDLSSINHDMAVIVGFVGDIKGQASFAMKEDVAISLSSILTGGMSISEIDEIVKSAIGELANMVMGNACTKFCERGIVLDITPPMVITGEDYRINAYSPMFYNDIVIEGIGKMHLDISVGDY
ncbi:MAG: chemotaxis protein CheX [Clostridia bacterium]|nr:chemotaxis protein CheX [Clostridia bacterium]